MKENNTAVKAAFDWKLAKRLNELKVRHENADLGNLVDAVRSATRTIRKEDRVRRAEYVQLELFACCKEQRGTSKSIRVAVAARENREAIRRFVDSGCKVLITREFIKRFNFNFNLQLFAEPPHQEQLFTDEDVEIAEYENTHRIETAVKRQRKLYDKKLRGKHRGNKRFMQALKSHVPGAKAYKITLMPSKTDLGFYAVLDMQNMSVTQLTEPYLSDEPVTFKTISDREVVAERALKGVALLDYSALDRRGDQYIIAGKRALKGNLIVGKIAGGKLDKVYFEEEGYIYDLKRSEKGENIIVDRKLIYHVSENTNNVICEDEDEACKDDKLRDGFVKFEVTINSSSQGRNDQGTLFSEPEKFLKVLNEVTFGESGLTFSSGIMNASGKEIADKCTRVGSKSCPMGATKTKLRSALISLSKDPNLDGTGLINSAYMAKAVSEERGDKLNGELIKALEGYTVQIRPWTVKAAAKTSNPIKMNVITSKHKIYVIDLDNIREIDKLVFRLSLDKVAKAHASKKDLETVAEALKGYDAIGLKDKDFQGWDVYGDLNFYKDAWDLEKTRESGLNVLAFGHYDGDRTDFNGVNTNAQFLKCVMNAVANSSNSKFLKLSDEIIKSVIDYNVEDLISLRQKPESFNGTDWINIGYLPGVVALLNPDTYVHNYSVMYTLLEQKLDTVNTVLNKDRYKVPGNNGMLTIDASYWYTGKSLLRSYVDDKDRFVFEVFNPVFEAYAEKHPGVKREGVAIKNPSVGTCEFALVKYVSLEELKKRCEEQCGKYANLVFSDYETFKEGGVMIPADLEVIALINAGLDLDGDKMIFFFAKENGKDFVTLMWKSGLKPRAVRIGTPGGINLSKLSQVERARAIVKEEATKAPLDMNIFKTYAVWNLENDNRGTGVVTNTIAIFTSLLIQWKLSKSKKVRTFAKELFEALGCVAGGRKDYKSIINVHVENGIEVYETSAAALEDFFEKAIKGVNINKEENILAMLEDLDILGRHCQELTIDAQKKFYTVFCKWIDSIKEFSVAKTYCSIELSLEIDKAHNFYIAVKADSPYSVKFNNDGELVVSFKTATQRVVDPSSGDLLEQAYITDAFTKYRVYAVQKMHKAITDELVEKLAKARQIKTWQKQKDDLARAKSQWSNPSGLLLLKGLARKMKTVNQSYKQCDDYFKERFKTLSKGWGKKMKKRLSEDMKKYLNEEHGLFVNAIDNEARKIMRNIVSPEKKVLIFDSLMLTDEKLSKKVLQPERYVKLCKESDNSVFEYELSKEDGVELTNLWKGRKVTVSNGCITLGEKLIEAPLLDGSYTIKKVDETVFLTRPYSEFINIPKIDEDMYFINAEVHCKESDNITKTWGDALKAKALFKKKDAKIFFGKIGNKKAPIFAEKGGEKLLNMNLGHCYKEEEYKAIGGDTTEFTLRKNLLVATKAYVDGVKIEQMITSTSKKADKRSGELTYYWNFAFVARA